MGNPFEDLRQAVVVRPMNSPGPQGAAGPEMKIQYSVDGISWHDDPVEIDRYLRFSTNNGVSWSDPVYFNNLSETLGWVDKAKRWAENPEDSEVEPGQYSALHHASKAALAASNAAAEASALIAPSIDKARKWAEHPENIPVENDQYSALHHASKAAISASNAEAAALDAAESAVEAFGAAAPPWDSTTIYNYNDVVSFDNGHTYRCIETNITGADYAPNIDGVDNEQYWTRITVSPDGYFEIDEDGNLMPMIAPITSEIFMLDENGDIMCQPDILPPSTIIQYSSDGVTWHENPSDTDIFIRFSTNFGASWGEPIRFVSLNEALTYVEKAKQWAENPEDEPVEPGQYSALHHKEKALDAQMQAAISASNALGSANSAAISEKNALASETKAYQWAENPEDVPVEDGKYSAYHWARKAENIAVSPPHGDEAHTEDYIKEGDPRLTDARNPIPHASTHVDGTDDIQLATSEQKGLMSSTYVIKLNGIEENANNYIHPATHSLDMITETDVLKIFTADERDRLATLGGIPI